MRNWLSIVLLLSIACCSMACSTKNEGALSNFDRGISGAFTVDTEPGTGLFTPALAVDENGANTTVTVSAQNAEQLSAAYLHLHYDARRFSPAQVEFSTYLGSTDEVLSLAVTSQAGDVPLGLAQIPETGVLPRTGNGVLATVHFTHTPFTSPRGTSGAPAGTRNKVDDLAITVQTATSATLAWTEKNVGDYDNNGMVGISDLTPLAILFGHSVASASDPVWAAMVDGSGDNTISVADLAPIGQNFGDRCDGYCLYTDASSSTLYNSSGIHAPRPALASINRKAPVPYSFTATFANGAQPEFSVRPILASDLTHPGPDSNHRTLIQDVPGAPEPPTNLVAVGNEGLGERTISLTWTLSTSTDVIKYEIYRKTTAGSSWAKIADATSTQTQYTNIDPSFTSQSYDYRMLAKDVTDQASGWSVTTSATPYLPPTLDPPLNPAAAPSGSKALAIDVTWDKPTNNYGTGFRVYRKGPGEGSFTALTPDIAFSVTKLVNEGLTTGQTYEYYVKTLHGTEESAACSTVNSIPSTDVQPIQITSVTTDKTTHLAGGSEGTAQITLVTDPDPADSYSWSGPGDFSSTSVKNPTWKPNASTSNGKVTLSVTVTLGATNATMPIDMYVTGESIKKSYAGRDGTTRPVGDPAGSGIAPDTTLTATDYLEPLSIGGAISAGTGTLHDVFAGHAVLFDEWELWCGPCKAEFPELDDYGEAYRDLGFLFVANSSDPGAGYGINDIKAWFQGNAIDFCDEYHGNIYAATWAKLGADGYIPFNVLIDRDGMVRKVGGQANGADWAACIKEITGAP
jgi:thiol-disulfide isomerase/thioredoxin